MKLRGMWQIGLFCFILVAIGQAQMIMYIDPPRIPLKSVGQQCTVMVRMRNTYGVYCWQAGLYFNSATLTGNTINFSNADSLLRYAYGASHNVFNFSGSWGSGILNYCGGAQFGVDSGGIGDGNVMQLIFNVVGSGSSIFDLTQSNTNAQAMIIDTSGKYPPFICQDGFYGNETVTPTSSFAINTATGHQTRPAVAWDNTNNQFLVVWEDYTSPGNQSASYIRGQRISANGDLLGSVINVHVSALYPAYSPCVSWNGTNYLVVFTRSYVADQRSFNIYGRTVSPTGAVGTDIAICTAPRYQGNPAIAWNGTYHLVVWMDAQNSLQLPRIYGQRLNNAGALEGSNFFISPEDNTYHQYPRVATNGSEFLVVWVDNYGSGSNYSTGRIRGQRVSSTGSLLGSVITISSGLSACPDVAWDGTNYLVVYQRATSGLEWDIYGQRVSSTGSLVGSAIAINTASNDQTWPRVVFDTQAGRYAVIWVSEQSMPAIYKQIVTTAGGLWLPSAVLQADANYQQMYPALANGSTNDMVVWADMRGGSNFDIYGTNPTIIGIEEETESQKLKAESPKLEIYPNPTSENLKIRLNLPQSEGDYSLAIYNATGRFVKTLNLFQGNHLTIQPSTQIVWDRKDQNGSIVDAGVYFVHLRSKAHTLTKKIIISK